MLAGFIIACLYVFFTIIQSAKKDYSIELTRRDLAHKQRELELMESHAKYLEKGQEQLQGVILQLNQSIRSIITRDSVFQDKILSVDQKLNHLSTRQYENVKAINSYDDTDLRKYYDDLPDYGNNDYLP